MTKTDPLDPNVPAGSESPRMGDDRMKELAKAVAELLNVDHYMGTDGGADVGYNEDAAGEHKKVTLNAPISTPSGVVNKLFLYGKDAGGKTEFHILDENGNEVQLTSSGDFNIALLTGKTITTPTLTNPVINTGVSGTAILDEDTMDSDSDTKLATQQSIKKYVDDQIKAKGLSAWVSFNSAGTKQESYNVYDVYKTDTGKFTIVWDTDFASNTYAIIATAGETQIAGPRVGTITKSQVEIWVSSHAGAPTDPVWCSVLALGAQ